jgi:PKD repeat protein
MVQFTDQSTGTITAWNWNFGDGSAHSSVQNPSHTYNSVADFTATLTITGSGGATSSKSTIIHVTAPPPPSANFTANPTSGQAPLTVQFTDQSTGTVTAWDWSFGDGSAHSSVQNPSHTYTSAGDFTVTLTVSCFGNPNSSKSMVIHVTAPPPPPPSASFTANPTSGQAPLTVQFTDQSSGTITAWDWNFGDGSAHSSVQNPSHTYSSAGDFTATLTVTGSGGATSSASLTIHVTAPPPKPILTVSITVSVTSEQSTTPGVCTISRTGDISAALTARYTLSGTAVNGVDYQTLSGSVEFAAGASAATVLIVPIDDHVLLEAAELVVLTLSVDDAYDIGQVNSGVVTILDPL